jgi:uncharacterized FAD-dependent dehydrogenase
MSYSSRKGSKANSAIVIAVNPEEFGSVHPLMGLEYQRRLEEKAYQIGGGKIPVMYYRDFRNAIYRPVANGAAQAETETETIRRFGKRIIPCTKGAWCFAPVHKILDREQNHAFIKAMSEFGRQIPGFDDDLTLIAGVESRTSSPVRILRDESFQSACRGLYPCGEGAGYAGGIMSAAMDGVRVAEAVARNANL